MTDTLLHALSIIPFYLFLYLGINGSEKSHKAQKITGIIGCLISFALVFLIALETSSKNRFLSFESKNLFRSFDSLDSSFLIVSIIYISISSRYNGKIFSIIVGILALVCFLFFLFFVLRFLVQPSHSIKGNAKNAVLSLIQMQFGLILLFFACLPSDRKIYSKDDKPKSEIEK